MPEKYDHIDFKPPAGVRAEAKKGLEWRDEYNRGGTMVGVARARDLSNGKNISPDTAKRMNSYFARHAVDKKGEGWSPGEDGFPSAGRIAWALWGGDAGEAWAGKLVRQIEAADKKERSLPVKTKRIKSWKSDEVPSQKMILRMVSVRAETANPETKSVEVVVASENPVERYDSERDSVIREILLMDGVEFRTERMQLPIVDSHDRSTVRNVLGSVRNIRTEGTQLVGDATFARDTDSQDAYQKLLDGHLTDFSITATPKQITSVRRGETYSLRGETIEGPADIVTRWMPTDASLVAAGADETSTVRDLQRSYFFNGDDLMKRALTEEMKAMLVAKGMPEQIEDPEQALTWVVGMMTEAAEESPEIEMENKPMENAMAAEEEMKKMEHPEKKMAEGMDQEEEIKQTVQRALKEDSKRRKEIVALCSAANIERSFAEQLCDTGVSLDIARTQILEKVLMSNQPLGASSGRERIEVTRSSDDKFNEAIRDGLISRAFRGAGLKSSPFSGGKPAEGSEEFKHFGLMRMAEKILQRQGVNTDRMSNRDIALAALGSPAVCNRFNIERSSYHTTGSFSNLLLDAANKTLLTAYEEAPTTYQLWARTAPAVADFKAVNRIRFSEAPDLEVVPETKPYKQGVMTDSKESYKVEKYGAIFTVSWETVVNDDLDAISRIPAMHGNAARRKVNKVVYNVLTSNPTMGDGYSLFSASHASGTNYANASAAPSVSTLNTAFRDMMKQKGLTSDAIINVTPRYLIVPVSVSAGALQLVGSLADPGAGGSAAGNSNSLNIYGPNGSRPLQVIVEPVLEAYSTTGWFLAADYASVDTVEVSFLQGEESPVLENEWDFNTDCYKYKVRQTFGVAAIDWRGLYKYHNA